MPNIEETVHIIPLGHEIDRAVKPFEKHKADRIYILTNLKNDSSSTEMSESQQFYYQKVVKILERKKIKVIPVTNVDLFSLRDVMKHVSKIIVDETGRNNRVFVNMSAAGRLTSVAATLAGMAHGANVYYVPADDYPTNTSAKKKHGLSICYSDTTKTLVNFEIGIPKDPGLKILLFLSQQEKRKKAIDLLQLLKKEKIEGFEQLFTEVEETRKRSVQSNQLMRLNKTILADLERKKYIHRERDGRYVYYSITESGRYIAHISGLLE